LLGNQVKAGLAVYGSGFYDLPSYFKAILDDMDSVSRNKWLSQLDAGRYASRITAPFYFMAASNDTYFHPPAVIATYNKIKGEKDILFAPNNDHSLTNVLSSDSTEMAFFDFYLKNNTIQIPTIKVQSAIKNSDQSQVVVFKVKEEIETATLWYSFGETDWMKKKWQPVVATKRRNKTYQVAMPKEVLSNEGSWYIIVTNKNKVSNGTVIY
jgi:PhoPQ-activated pathogenicity-related protein